MDAGANSRCCGPPLARSTLLHQGMSSSRSMDQALLKIAELSRSVGDQGLIEAGYGFQVGGPQQWQGYALEWTQSDRSARDT
jgi:hypothetical protein